MKFSRRDATWYALTLLLAGVIVAILRLTATPPPPPRDLQTAYYVWQMQWNDDVRDAVRSAAPTAQGFMVQIGAIDASKKELRFSPAYPHWATLAEQRVPVTLVLRANAALGDLLLSGERAAAQTFVANTLDNALAGAQAAGVTVRGLQLDYDCPSAKLATYRTLLEPLRTRYKGYELSITALPTWLRWNDFAPLVDGLAYYVLQVHSLEPPSRIGEPIVLCDTGRIPGYVRRAASFGVPFYVALPTYGYRVVYDAAGKFAALIAEGPEPALKPGYQVRTAMADAGEIAAVVDALRKRPPNGLLGIAWFRLPVATDDLNWSWPALQAVREGRAPTLAFQAELRSPSPGLQEVWIRNTGEDDAASDVHVDVRFPPGAVVASDTHNGYKNGAVSGSSTATLSGPAPRPQKEVLAAWFRLRDGVSDAATGQSPLTLGPVGVDGR